MVTFLDASVSRFPPPLCEVSIATVRPLVRSLSIAHKSLFVARTSPTTVLFIKVMPELFYYKTKLISCRQSLLHAHSVTELMSKVSCRSKLRVGCCWELSDTGCIPVSPTCRSSKRHSSPAAFTQNIFAKIWGQWTWAVSGNEGKKSLLIGC